MSLDIGAAIRDGFGRTFRRNGLLLMVVFLALGAANTVVADTMNQLLIEQVRSMPGDPPPTFPIGDEAAAFALPISLPAALALALVVALVAEAVRIVAVRTLVSQETGTIPREFVTRRIAWVTVNGFVAGVVVGVLITIGLVLLIVPGVFLAIAFFFVRQEIAVEDKNFVAAMADSWSLTKGSRLELLALALVVFVIGLLASIPGVVLVFLSPEATAIVSTVVGAVTTVFGVAVASRAYDQLRAEREEEEDLTHWEELDG